MQVNNFKPLNFINFTQAFGKTFMFNKIAGPFFQDFYFDN